MIKLSHAPIEGSGIKLRLSFKDSFGNYYVPLSVTYSFLALNSDKETWSVVGDNYEKSLNPSSTIVLTIEDSSIISGTTNQRKVVVTWTAYLDGEETDFVDEVSFEIQPKPIVINPPTPTPTTKYVEVVDMKTQMGSKESTAITPVFYFTFNVPVNLDTIIAKLTGTDGVETETEVELNATKTIATISSASVLKTLSSYTLNVSGVKSLAGYGMKEDYEYSFITAKEFTTSEEIIETLDNLETKIDTLGDNLDDTNENVTNIQNCIMTGTTILNRLTHKEYVDNLIKTETDKIKALFPEAATEINQLTDKAYVDSEVKKISDVVSPDASSSNYLTDKLYVDNAVSEKAKSIKNLMSADATSENPVIDKAYVDSEVKKISNVISPDASETNQLTDKAYVDSEVKKISNVISPDASLSNYLIDKKYVDNEIDSKAKSIKNLMSADATSENPVIDKAYVDEIKELVPEQASKENQLADKEFVNSSIATSTANFLGTYTSIDDFPTNATHNDYVYYKHTDESGNTVFTRYKWNADDKKWNYEYDLNNSSFTEEQWKAINSGITEETLELLNNAKHTHTNMEILNNVTQKVIDNEHTHTNKDTLDSITSDVLLALLNDEHTHTNKDTLDKITSDVLSSLLNDEHTHANKDTLDKITSDVLSSLLNDEHTHANKNILDLFNDKEKAEAIINNEHTHTNKDTLDKITSAVLSALLSDEHTHTNKDTLDKISVSEDSSGNKTLMYDNTEVSAKPSYPVGTVVELDGDIDPNDVYDGTWVEVE